MGGVGGGFNLLIEGLIYRPKWSLLKVGITVLENLSLQFLLTSLSNFLYFSLDVTVSNLNIYINSSKTGIYINTCNVPMT
jgi:hypothetical protein